MGPVSSASDDDLAPGRVLGPYELVVPVGAGGMARVWAARVRATGQIVALKMLLPQLAENPSFQEMFLDEARIASRVRHPNVCATFELGDYDGILTLAMEWVDGGSLVRMLRPGPETDERRPRVPLPFRHAARIVAEVCAGLHAAHELVGDDGRSLAVVHRDVSPHNVLVTTAGDIKVTDFGVAKALGKSHMTIAGQIKGKLAYMSPEQLMGGAVDRRSDVFALGCVLYEITTGERPFRGEHDPQVMAAIMIGQFEPPSAFMAGYPPELDGIVVRALASDPAQRFPTADHMRMALEQYLRSSGPPVEPRHVASLLHERLGGEIEARGHALTSAAQSRGFGGGAGDSAGGSGSGSRAAMEVDRRASAGPLPAAGVIGLALAVLIGSGLGLGVLSYVRATRRARPAATSAELPSVTAPSSAAAVAEPPPPSATAMATATAAAPTAEPGRSATVHLSLEPSTATVVVDGIELPPGTRTVLRAEDGAARTIVVRADDYEDPMVIIDPATPDEIEVALVPVAAPAPARREPPRPAVTATTSASEALPEVPPPNPYE